MLRKTFIFTFIFILALTSCTSVKDVIENGNYDQAIDLAVRKLKGSKKKKTENIQGLELALEKANNRDLNTIDHLLADNNPRNWERINSIYKGIQARQQKIYPLLPLKSKDGYEGKFQFADVAALERESRQKAVEYMYGQAKNLLEKGKDGDRIAARDAYALLKKIDCNYIPEYCDTEKLLVDAKNLGTTHILVEMRNQTNVYLPADFEYRMMHLSQNDLSKSWTAYHFSKEDRKDYDYKVVIKLNNIMVSPERMNTREYTDEKTIEDGFEYVLDRAGNVKKDSLGKDIKTKKYIKVHAHVKEVYQTKEAIVGGDIEIYDYNTRALLDSERLGAQVNFANYASTYNGDKRALSTETCNRIGNKPLPFPSDLNMLEDAADDLKPDISEKLRTSRMII